MSKGQCTIASSVVYLLEPTPCQLEGLVRTMSVSRRRITGFVALIVIFLIGSVYVFPSLFQNGDSGSPDSDVIEPHYFNDLNWWDIPNELAFTSDLVTYMSGIDKYKTRHMLTEPEAYYDAAEYISQKLEALGVETWYEGEHQSLMGVKKGFGNDDRAIIFSAYLDTEINFEYPLNFNTGACAMLLLIAEILSNYRLSIDVYFSFPSYSKSGDYLPSGTLVPLYYGAEEISDYLIDNNIDILALYDFEGLMLADEGYYAGVDLTEPYRQSSFLAELLRVFLLRNGRDILTVTANDFDLSDQVVYLPKGIPTVHVEGRDTIDPDNPPVESIYSSDYSLDKVLALAKASASLAVFLSYSGNGNDVSEKLVLELESLQSVVDWKMMSISSPLSVEMTANASASIDIQLQDDEGNLIDAVTLSGQTASATLSESPGIGPRRTLVRNTGNSSIQVQLVFDYQFDFDGDDVPDSQQYSWPDPVPAIDWDHDGLSDTEERIAGTDIFIRDTDHDSMLDGYEVDYGLDPLRNDQLGDLDADGLTNIREHTLGTFPNSTDTDRDGMDDFWEVSFLTDPLVDDALEDPDNDTLTNLDEYLHGADPMSADGDFDGVPDVEEVALGMNPLSDDTDGDGLRDQLELLEGLDPLRPDYDFDLTPDGLDHNPRINSLLVIFGLAFLPVLIGTVFFWKRLQ